MERLGYILTAFGTALLAMVLLAVLIAGAGTWLDRYLIRHFPRYHEYVTGGLLLIGLGLLSILAGFLLTR